VVKYLMIIYVQRNVSEYEEIGIVDVNVPQPCMSYLYV